MSRSRIEVRLAQGLACAVLLLSSSLACRDGGDRIGVSDAAKAVPPSTAVSQASTDPTTERLAALVGEWGQGNAQVFKERDPYYLLGDFNGDGNADAAVVVQFKDDGASRRLAGGATVSNPWLRSVEPAAKDIHDTGSDKALFVFHGTAARWDGSAPKSVFVLLNAVYDELKILRRGTVDNDVTLPTTAKGDGFLTGTEEAKGIIYWDGEAYLWKQHGD